MVQYKLVKDSVVFGLSTCIIRLSDNARIPKDESNTDYQAYLKWLEEGGVPLPADE